ncbi:hypothetical protein Slin14017_G093270 [Septoria linicola]|nr:hypothetical protein Slin14017_G093270 [Septoria linicola]
MSQNSSVSRYMPSYQGSLSTWRKDAWSKDAETDVISVVSPPCSKLSRKLATTSLAKVDNHDAQKGLSGLVAYLPPGRKIPADSVIFSHFPDVNDGAYDHPVVVLGHSVCTKFVFCAPVTSFSNYPSLQAKYEADCPRDKNFHVYWRYMSIAHNGGQGSPNHMDQLQTIGGRQMSRQSYVNLDGGFWIEARYLSPFLGDKIRMTDRSLTLLKWAYCAAERHRGRHGALATTKKRTRPRVYISPTPAPVPTIPARCSVQAGFTWPSPGPTATSYKTAAMTGASWRRVC